MIHRYCNARSRPDRMGEKKAHLRILTEYHPTQTLQRKEPSPWAHPEAPKKKPDLSRSWISSKWIHSRCLQMSPVSPVSIVSHRPIWSVGLASLRSCRCFCSSSRRRLTLSMRTCPGRPGRPGRWRQGNLRLGKKKREIHHVFHGYV